MLKQSVELYVGYLRSTDGKVPTHTAVNFYEIDIVQTQCTRYCVVLVNAYHCVTSVTCIVSDCFT